MVPTIVEIERKPVLKRSLSIRSLVSGFHMVCTITKLFLAVVVAIMLKPASHLRFQCLTSRPRGRDKRETMGTRFTALLDSRTQVSANFRGFICRNTDILYS